MLPSRTTWRSPSLKDSSAFAVPLGEILHHQTATKGNESENNKPVVMHFATNALKLKRVDTRFKAMSRDWALFSPHPTETVLAFLRGLESSIDLGDFTTQANLLDMFGVNIDVVNQAFQGTPFKFRFAPKHTTVTVSNDWSNDAMEYRQMSQAVGSGNLRVLDVFVAWSLGDGEESSLVLGIASLPAAQISGQGDGLVLRHRPSRLALAFAVDQSRIDKTVYHLVLTNKNHTLAKK